MIDPQILPDKVNPGDETPVQIAPLGDWPARLDDGTVVIQKLDEVAVSRLVEAFSGNILVDADHHSETGGSTEALAWITELRNDPEHGLVGIFKWTDSGAQAVTGRRYRFVSASWTADRDGRPERLLSVALTNRPNIPSHPILNSVQDATKEQPKGNETMEKIREQLGLAPEATEDDIVTAIAAVQAELEELKVEAKEREAETFAAANDDKVDHEVLKNAYMTDPKLAKMLVANIKPAAKPGETVVENSRPAATPEEPPRRTVCNSRTASRPILNGIAQCKSPQERVDFIKAHAAEMSLI